MSCKSTEVEDEDLSQFISNSKEGQKFLMNLEEAFIHLKLYARSMYCINLFEYKLDCTFSYFRMHPERLRQYVF